MTKSHGHLDPYSYDKRNYHGALARHSPFSGTDQCAGCLRPMNKIEVKVNGTVCERCRAQGWMTPEEWAQKGRGCDQNTA